MHKIEEILERKIAGGSGDVFLTQWKVAKAQIPALLGTIAHVFPHYSLHDESHSISILSNITRLVGMDTLEKFSVGDLWLLLCSAYCHDMGMAISAKDKQKWFDDPECAREYVDFIRDIQQNEHSDLFEHASIYEIRDDRLFMSGVAVTSANYDSSRYLLSQFVRSRHADRSAASIQTHPLFRIFESCIPARMITILSRVCLTHNLDRTRILDLPFEESTGFDDDVCHPRYIAALLRLGDLLDVDSNRISGVLLSSINNIPRNSLSYNQTNRDIEHIHISPERLELKATCHSIETAALMQGWFDMTEEELKFQMSKWSDIVPSRDYGFLPMIAQLEVIPDGYEALEEKIVPRFSFDQRKVFELVQGSNLYSREEVFVREVLQNAIDAVILRLFVEGKTGGTYESFKQGCKDYGEIRFGLKRADGGKWICEVKDNGIGLDKHRFKYLLEVGSSHRNKEKHAIIARMPEWMRPSGTFGIGFQSLFLVTDRIEIRSRHLRSDKTYLAEMFNPLKFPGKPVYMKGYDGGDIGTTIRFEINTEEKGNNGSVRSDQPFAYSYFNNFDFVKTDMSELLIRKAVDEAMHIASGSHMDIDVDFNDSIMWHPKSDLDDYFDKETNLGISVENQLDRPQLFYRGIRVPNSPFMLEKLPVKVNILSSDSKKVLTLDRENIRDEYMPELLKNFNAAAGRMFSQKKYYHKLKKEFRPYISLWLKSIGVTPKDDALRDDWKKAKFIFHSEKRERLEISIDEILGFEDIYYNQLLEIVKDGETYGLTSDASSRLRFFGRVINCILSEEFPYISFKDGIVICSRIKEHCPEYYSQDDASRLAILHELANYRHGARSYLPCHNDYKVLAVADRERRVYDPVFRGLGRDVPMMVSPFTNQRPLSQFLFEVDTAVIDYVFRHRADKSVTRVEIEEAYGKMRRDFEDALETFNKEAEEKAKA